MATKEFSTPSNPNSKAKYIFADEKSHSSAWNKKLKTDELLERLIELELCTPVPILGNVVLSEGELYCQQVYFNRKNCCFEAFNPISQCFQEINLMSSKIGLNTTAFFPEVRPFTCEIPAPVGGGAVIVTNADLIAALAGATFNPSNLPADDAATVYLHRMEAVLTNVNDEAAGGFIATGCQAVATDVQTGKTKDIEPGGNYEFTVKPGQDVPAFSIEIAEGSNMVFCGEVSIRLDKANAVVPK